MPRTKSFNEEAVLRKAVDLFWKKGYNGTSIQDLVDHLGINRASIYSTYGNKEELFKKAFVFYQEKSHAGVMEMLNSFDSIKEGIKKLFHWAVEDTLSDAERKGCFAVNMAGELQPENLALKNMLLDNQSFMVKVFKDYLQRGVDQGEISNDKDLDAIAMYLFTLSNGIRIVSKVDNDRAGLNRMLKSALTVLD